ncbi:ski-like protein [Stigmatopora nigra]
MAGTQTGLKSPFKGLNSFKGATKRPYRERPEAAPIKKRVMAEIKLKRRGLESFHKVAKVKREQAQDEAELLAAKALDLSPGLKHTLAQFTLSSQSSLGGPAAFSARGNNGSHDGSQGGGGAPPPPSPPAPGSGPLLVPCDSSTELTHSPLEGESISCFVVGGEKRLCLPQVLNSVLRDFSLQQINTVCDELYVYCSRCDGDQLHILKVLGILPFNAPSCGLITLTDAQRLCNALLRPGQAPPAELGGNGARSPGGRGLKEGRAGAGSAFRVEHQCLGKCQGLFLPRLYSQPEAPCVQCVECRLLFSPQKFVMHSHKSPDKRTCHWGFDSAKWPCYLQLARKYQGSPDEAELRRLLDQVKEKFHYRIQRTPDQKATAGDEDPEKQAGNKASADLCSPGGKLAEAEPTGKAKNSRTLLYNHLFPDIKEEPGHPVLAHPSYYLYPYDKMVAPNVSLRREAEMSPEMMSALLKHHYGRGVPQHHHHHHDEPPMDLHASPALADEAKSQHGAEHECKAQAVSMETSNPSAKIAVRGPPPPLPPASPPPPPPVTESAEDDAGRAVNLTAGGPAEDDKDRIVVEIIQMYGKQQEKLNSTLHKQLQLEMELEALRGGEAARLRELSAEQRELRSELEAVHSEQARQLGRARQEQLELEARLEQLRRQACTCEASTQPQQEAQYAAQLSELRLRLESAEADRQELQDELRQEREAREVLERTIGQLKQQMSQSAQSTQLAQSAVPAGGSPSPPLTPSAGPPSAHSPASDK